MTLKEPPLTGKGLLTIVMWMALLVFPAYVLQPFPESLKPGAIRAELPTTWEKVFLLNTPSWDDL